MPVFLLLLVGVSLCHFCLQSLGVQVRSPRLESPQVLVPNPAFLALEGPQGAAASGASGWSPPPHLEQHWQARGVVVTTLEEGHGIRRLRLHRPNGVSPVGRGLAAVSLQLDAGSGFSPGEGGQGEGGQGEVGGLGLGAGRRGTSGPGTGTVAQGSAVGMGSRSGGDASSPPSATSGLHQYFHRGAGRQPHRAHGTLAGYEVQPRSQEPPPVLPASPTSHARATFNPHYLRGAASEGWCCGLPLSALSLLSCSPP